MTQPEFPPDRKVRLPAAVTAQVAQMQPAPRWHGHMLIRMGFQSHSVRLLHAALYYIQQRKKGYLDVRL